MPPAGPLAFQLKFGRTSAPLLPHALHAKGASRSDSRTSSGHRSALIAIRMAAVMVAALERFPAKWIPVRVKKTRQKKK